jgi:hypothetical protein
VGRGRAGVVGQYKAYEGGKPAQAALHAKSKDFEQVRSHICTCVCAHAIMRIHVLHPKSKDLEQARALARSLARSLAQNLQK